MRRFLVLAVMVGSVVAAGCDGEAGKVDLSGESASADGGVVLKWLVIYPDVTAEDIDELVALKLDHTLLAVPGVERVRMISHAGVCEVYVQARPGFRPEDLQAAVADEELMRDLPADAGRGPVSLVVSGLPTVSPLPTEEIVVRIDRDAVIALGGSVLEVSRQIQQLDREMTPETLSEIYVEMADGTHIPLSELATTEKVTVPSCIVRTSPPDDL